MNKFSFFIFSFCAIGFESIAQNKFSFDTGFGPVKFGSGGREGLSLSSGISRNFLKGYSIGMQLNQMNGFAQYDSYYQSIPNGPRDKNAPFRAAISYSQFLALFSKNFLPAKKLSFSLGFGPAFGQKTSDLPKSFNVLFPVITNYNDPIYQINYPDKFKSNEFSIVGNTYIHFRFNSKFQMKVGGVLQKSFSEEIISFPIGFDIILN